MLKIQSAFEADVFYREGVTSKPAVENAVSEFEQKGVNVIFGHGNAYAAHFNDIAPAHPEMHFVSFNGHATQPNTTSLKFEGYAMGFFGGMTAAYMSRGNKVGVIAAFGWQPEVKGFIDGAKHQEHNTEVLVMYTENWDDRDIAIQRFEEMMAKGADVIYPAGDGFNVPVIEKIKEHGLYAIGYVSDQSDLGESTVLTSTVQHVDKLYELVAKRFEEGTLESGNLSFDFKDGVITMGSFSPLVDKAFQEKMDRHINHYMETGKLPE